MEQRSSTADRRRLGEWPRTISRSCATKVWTPPTTRVRGAVATLNKSIDQDIGHHLPTILLGHVDHEWAQFIHAHHPYM